MVKNLPTVWKIQVWSLGQEDSLEKGMATHSSILAWRIPWTEEPGYSPWSPRVNVTEWLTLSLSLFTFSPTVYKGSLFSTFSSTFVICGHFDDSHSDTCEVIYHFGFNFHFPDDQWCWASFHVAVTTCNSSSEKCLFSSYLHFLIGLFVFLILSYMNCLYMLDINPLSVLSFGNLFSHSVGCKMTDFYVLQLLWGLILTKYVIKLFSF